MKKEYHIVHGYNASGNLKKSNVVDFDSPNVSLIFLYDNLSEGKLFEIKNLQGIDDRINWFESFYGAIDAYYFRDQLAKDVSNQLSEIKSGDEVYIYLGLTSDEYIWCAAVLNFLKETEAIIYVIEWQDMFLKNSDGENRRIRTIGHIGYNDVAIVREKFRILSNSELHQWSQKWENFFTNNTDLRILHNINDIKEVSSNYFDDLIQSFCSKEYKSSIRLVVNIWDMQEYYGLGDDFILERIRELVRSKVLEIENPDTINERKFFVKLP